MSTTSISPIQERAVELLLAGSSVAAAARELGIDRTTIYNWRKNHPFFSIALHQARKLHTEYLSDSLRDLASAAVDTLHELLTSKDVPPAVRLRAAQAVLTKATPSAVAATPAIEPQTGINHAGIEALIGPPVPHNSTQFDTFDEIDLPESGPETVVKTPGLPQTIRRQSAKVGRNEPCPCGSSLKYKRCCGNGISALQARAA